MLSSNHDVLASNKSNTTPRSSSSSTAIRGGSTSTPVPSVLAEEELTSCKSNNNNNNNNSHSIYEEMVRRLYMTNLFHPVKMGLQNIEQLHEALGSPMDDPNTSIIHIAGTNGKGSVAFKTAKTLELAGHRVGLFVSPHVSSFRERMSVNGVPISESEVADLLPKIFATCQSHDIPATFFEITTALAFLFYRKNNVDVIVLETGLGGRLDATNIVKNPALTIITSIGLEHTRILGDTIELIAREKAGIMKHNCPVLVGPDVPHDVLRECAREKQASSYETCDEVLLGMVDDTTHTTTTANKVKDYDLENARIAKAAMHILQRTTNATTVHPITQAHIQQGTQIRPPCRFEKVQLGNVTVILDVAHNPPAMQHLTHKLETTFPNQPLRFIAGFSSDKDLALCGLHLLKATNHQPDNIHVITASHPRAATYEQIVQACPALLSSDYNSNSIVDTNITLQIQRAIQLASQNNEVLVICGSVFIMAEAREALGFDEPRDSDYISEVAGCNLRHGQENFGNDTTTTSSNSSSAIG